MGKKDKDDFESKFEKRGQSTLEDTYNNRDMQSKGSGGGNGKTIFDIKKLEKYGINIVKIPIKKAQYAWDFLPPAFSKDIPYTVDVPVHQAVGIDNDSFICMKRFKTGDCHRCKIQQKMFQNEEPTDKVKRLYPQDRIAFIFYDRTIEFTDKETPEPRISIATLPKKACQPQIQDLVRNKKTQKIYDISDISEDGEGKTVYFQVNIKEGDKEKGKQAPKFPNYVSFALEDREEPIPRKVIKKLVELIEDAEEENMNAIEYLLHFPDDAEIEKSMATENNNEEKTGKKLKDSGDDDRKQQRSSSDNVSEKKLKKMDIDDLEEELKEMKSEKILSWAEKYDLEDIVNEDMSKREMVSTLLEHIAELQDN